MFKGQNKVHVMMNLVIVLKTGYELYLIFQSNILLF